MEGVVRIDRVPCRGAPPHCNASQKRPSVVEHLTHIAIQIDSQDRYGVMQTNGLRLGETIEPSRFRQEAAAQYAW